MCLLHIPCPYLVSLIILSHSSLAAGERCLHDDTDIQLLCSANPKATWVIKPKDDPLDLV